jgi:hypothetical protein
MRHFKRTLEAEMVENEVPQIKWQSNQKQVRRKIAKQ